MFSKKTYLARIYAIAASLVLICEILARVLWIGGGPNNDQYYDLRATISSLYDPSYPAANPIGEYFFWASMIIVGLLIFAMIAYVHPRFMQGAKDGLSWVLYLCFWGVLDFYLLVPSPSIHWILLVSDFMKFPPKSVGRSNYRCDVLWSCLSTRKINCKSKNLLVNLYDVFDLHSSPAKFIIRRLHYGNRSTLGRQFFNPSKF